MSDSGGIAKPIFCIVIFTPRKEIPLRYAAIYHRQIKSIYRYWMGGCALYFFVKCIGVFPPESVVSVAGKLLDFIDFQMGEK